MQLSGRQTGSQIIDWLTAGDVLDFFGVQFRDGRTGFLCCPYGTPRLYVEEIAHVKILKLRWSHIKLTPWINESSGTLLNLRLCLIAATFR